MILHMFLHHMCMHNGAVQVQLQLQYHTHLWWSKLNTAVQICTFIQMCTCIQMLIPQITQMRYVFIYGVVVNFAATYKLYNCLHRIRKVCVYVYVYIYIHVHIWI